jgi:hypothetical protein
LVHGPLPVARRQALDHELRRDPYVRAVVRARGKVGFREDGQIRNSHGQGSCRMPSPYAVVRIRYESSGNCAASVRYSRSIKTAWPLPGGGFLRISPWTISSSGSSGSASASANISPCVVELIQKNKPGEDIPSGRAQQPKTDLSFIRPGCERRGHSPR